MSKLQDLRIKRASPAPRARDAYADLKVQLLRRLNQEIGPQLNTRHLAEARTLLQMQFDAILAEENIVLTRIERRSLFEDIVAEMLGFGPLERFLSMDDVTQIMVNGPKHVFIERFGQLERTDIVFEDDAHVLRTIHRILAPLGKKINPQTPVVSARLQDGSHINAIIPPVALNGPTLTIHRFSRIPFTVEKLLQNNTLTPEIVQFLQACVSGKLNILVSGNIDSGRTTLLNILCGFIPEQERILTIEEAAELRLTQPHVVRLESQDIFTGEEQSISKHDLVMNALRMRPDRLIIGELRGEETLALLHAMHMGHDGSMCTLFATSTRDALNRMETLALIGGAKAPQPVLKEQIAGAIDLIIHQERLRDGSRRVMAISEVLSVEGNVISTAEIFHFEQTGLENGIVNGRLEPTGLRPKFMWKLRDAGYLLPPAIFGIGSQRSRR